MKDLGKISEVIEKLDTITLTKNELEIFIKDFVQGCGSWSDTSYRICKFLNIDPTDGT